MRADEIVKCPSQGLRVCAIFAADSKSADWALRSCLFVLGRRNQLVMPLRDRVCAGKIEGRWQVSHRMIYQLAATITRCEQSFNVQVLKLSFRGETRRAVHEPSKRLAFGNDTLRQLGRPHAIRTYLGEMRGGNRVKFLVDFPNPLS